MKVTYDKNTYNIGDTFETKDGKAMLVASCSAKQVGMLMLDGIHVGKMWAGMKQVKDINAITQNEFESACGHNLKITEVGHVFSPVTITLETEDELKYIWAALSPTKCTIVEMGEAWNTGKLKSVNSFDMWKSVDTVCVEFGMKEVSGLFKE